MPRVAKQQPSTAPTQIAVDWLVRLRDSDLSEAETHAFADWLSQDVENAAAFARAERYFDEMVSAEKLLTAAKVIPAVQERKPVRPEKTAPRKTFKPWLALPLSLAAAWLVAVGLVLPSQASLLDNLISDYHTQTGEIREITLNDGSQLLLNTNTAVSVDYRTEQRRITLHHGQIRCTVVTDAARPFEVQADGLRVKALGTVFEIYRKSADNIAVTVQEHAVAARIEATGHANGNDQPAQVTVQTGQQLLYNGDGNLPPPAQANLAQTAAWQHRHLSIKDRPLVELVEELNRYRLGRVYLAGDALKKLRVTGVFPLDNPDAALTSVRKVLGLQESRLGPWRVLHR